MQLHHPFAVHAVDAERHLDLLVQHHKHFHTLHNVVVVIAVIIMNLSYFCFFVISISHLLGFAKNDLVQTPSVALLKHYLRYQ